MWLLNKLFDHSDQPTPRFAFQGTVNWMRGLAILCDDGFSNQDLRVFYRNVQRRRPNDVADAQAYEFLVMSMHNVSAIDGIEEIQNPYPIVRSAIIAWYYATYYASKAMLASSSGSNPQSHALTAKIWQSEIVDNNLAKKPFGYSIANLTPRNIEQEVAALRNGNQHDLNTKPNTSEMALGAVLSYLKGTAEYEKWHIEEKVKDSSEFKRGGYSNFRSKSARDLRDQKLRPAMVNFLVQAFRYRGKANYRDAIYLSYGPDQSKVLTQFIADLGIVGKSFSLMAAHYVAKRVNRSDWPEFTADIMEHCLFTMPYDPGEI